MKKTEELEEIKVIRVNNIDDVINAADLLKTIGIHVFSSDEQKIIFINTKSVDDGNYLINYSENNWRVQSYHIEEGISLDELKEKIEELIEIYPDIKNSMEGVESMTEGLKKVRSSLSEIEIPELRFDGKYFEEYKQNDIEVIIETMSEIKEKIEELRLMLL